MALDTIVAAYDNFSIEALRCFDDNFDFTRGFNSLLPLLGFEI